MLLKEWWEGLPAFRRKLLLEDSESLSSLQVPIPILVSLHRHRLQCVGDLRATALADIERYLEHVPHGFTALCRAMHQIKLVPGSIDADTQGELKIAKLGLLMVLQKNDRRLKSRIKLGIKSAPLRRRLQDLPIFAESNPNPGFDLDVEAFLRNIAEAKDWYFCFRCPMPACSTYYYTPGDSIDAVCQSCTAALDSQRRPGAPNTAPAKSDMSYHGGRFGSGEW